jgi:phage shock protein A
MGIFSRFSDIVSANIVHMLDRAEDPEKMVRLMIQEMEETLVEVKSSAAKLIADQKQLERQQESWSSELTDWQAKAEIAVRKGRDDLARAALAEKNRASANYDKVGRELNHVGEQIAKLREDIKTLTAKRDDARQRQKMLIMRRQTAENQLKIQSTVARASSHKAFTKFEQYESQLDRLEGQVDVERGAVPAHQSLADEIAELQESEQVESELAAIKQKLVRPDGESQADDKPMTVN